MPVGFPAVGVFVADDLDVALLDRRIEHLLLAFTQDIDSIYASVDGGRTWERRDQGLSEQDVYSLACIVFHALAGEAPRHAKSTRGVVAMRLTQSPQRVSLPQSSCRVLLVLILLPIFHH